MPFEHGLAVQINDWHQKSIIDRYWWAGRHSSAVVNTDPRPQPLRWYSPQIVRFECWLHELLWKTSSRQVNLRGRTDRRTDWLVDEWGVYMWHGEAGKAVENSFWAALTLGKNNNAQIRDISSHVLDKCMAQSPRMTRRISFTLQ